MSQPLFNVTVETILYALDALGVVAEHLGAERIGIQLATGLLAFFKNGKWGFVDTAGHIVVEPTYDEPAHFIPPFRGIAWAKRDDRWCAIDRHGRQVQHIPCREKDPFPTDRFECKVEP